MKLTRSLVVVAQCSLLVVTSGCGWITGEQGLIRDRQLDYRQAKVTDPLELPAGADTSVIRDLYVIPGAGQPLSFEEEFTIPSPDSQIGPAKKDLRAFKSGNNYWIVMDGKPGSVWGRVQKFWELNDIELETEKPSQGLMETAWLTREINGQKTRDKFRIRLEHGLQEYTSEIYIMHLGYPADQPEIPAAQLNWQNVQAGDELAIAMMQEISSFLIKTEQEAAPASLLAQRFAGKPKASLAVDEKGEPVIVMKLGFDRAWNAVGKAIEESGFKLEDQDRSSGIYTLQVYANENAAQQKKGLFSFFDQSDATPEQQGERLALKLQRKGEQIIVSLSATDETSPSRAEFRKAILSKIKGHLI